MIIVVFGNLYFTSVATQLKCGGMFSNNFTTNFPQNVLVKKVENRLIFGEDMDKSLQLTFLGPPCITATNRYYTSAICLGLKISHPRNNNVQYSITFPISYTMPTNFTYLTSYHALHIIVFTMPHIFH